ncbi:SMI1/KNR4 family protein [Flectobacillus major]|uniref:SMI1/KNR4 family protein n=1 Tax=Flectobacillus major TaxID=103 RepID=UPI0005C565D2|nr:SMI1/KNR4 family protein [Flectobacillus major]
MDNQLDNIKNKLELLRQLDINLEVFGSEKHKYILNPTVPTDIVKQFEAKHKITLPREYVSFFTTLGNGGAGPFYGLEPFENAIFDDLDFKREDGLLNPSKPFLHTDAWNMEFEPTVSEDENEEEYDRQYEKFTDLYFDSEHTNGVLAICNYGCGITLNLVVNGQEYGNIWTDDRGNDGGIYPTIQLGEKAKISFLDWYELWLDNSISEIKSRLNSNTKQNIETNKPWWKIW